MDHLRIIRRAFDITRAYKALWIFGILLALTTGRGGGNGGSSSSSAGSSGGFSPVFPNGRFDFPWTTFSAIIPFLVSALCLVLILAVIFTIIHYLSLTTLVRMVDRYEATGEKVSVREGFRLGWTRAAAKVWFVDLVFTLAAILAFLLLLAVALAPALLWLTRDNTLGIIGTIVAVCLFFLVVLLIVLTSVAFSMIMELIHRAIILENLSMMDGIRRGFSLFRRRLGDIIIMGLLLFGISLLFSLMLIPVVIILFLVGVVTGGLPALLAGGLANIFVHGNTPQVIALLVGLPILFLVLAIPLLFIGGLFEAYKSSVWTLTYRELLATDALRPVAPSAPKLPTEPAPEPEPIQPEEPAL
jgi:hypothetical protein